MKPFILGGYLSCILSVFQAFGAPLAPVEDAYRNKLSTDQHFLAGHLAFVEIIEAVHQNWRLAVRIQEDTKGTLISCAEVRVFGLTERSGEIRAVQDNPLAKTFVSDGKTSAVAKGIYKLDLVPGDRVIAVRLEYMGVTSSYRLSQPFDPKQSPE